MGARDQETRRRLLQASARLFAERGYDKVTVRDICRKARANVAAVNYHFGGKLGLYHAVLEEAIRTMQATTAAARDAGRGLPPAERLHAYVRIFIERLTGASRESWIHQLMMRELSDPTPALEMVMTQVVRPRLAFLAEIVAALLGCPPDDPRVEPCAMSVHMQCLSAARNPLEHRAEPGALPPAAVAALVDHVTRFSLGGVSALR